MVRDAPMIHTAPDVGACVLPDLGYVLTDRKDDIMKISLVWVVGISLALAGALSLAGVSACLPQAAAEDGKDIVDTAVAAGNFKTLAAALKAADLVDTLKGKGPFTVFAPTDEAFAKLPAGTLDDLLKPENKAKLAGILTYHVVAGKVMAADVVKLKAAKTVNGKEVSISVEDGTVMLDGKAKVTKTDIGCSNGVIHVIDAVLLP